MCFEWDKRYFRELEEKKNKEKVDNMIKNAEAAVKAGQANETAKGADQPVKHKENTPA